MPNHCHNKVTLIGPKADVAAIRENKWSFDFIAPPPADIKESELYEWHCENWGTKWDNYNYEEVISEDNYLCVTFDTAWAPPLRVFEKLLEKYPHCWIKDAVDIEFGSSGIVIGRIDSEGDVELRHMLWDTPLAYFEDEHLYVSDTSPSSEAHEPIHIIETFPVPLKGRVIKKRPEDKKIEGESV